MFLSIHTIIFEGPDVTDTPATRERTTTILVAEDDDALRGIVTRVFWDQGYRTLEARHGSEALHLAELAAPYLDLVVTDVIMPELDGLELGRELALRWSSIPVLYISAYPSNDIFSRGGPTDNDAIPAEAVQWGRAAGEGARDAGGVEERPGYVGRGLVEG